MRSQRTVPVCAYQHEAHGWVVVGNGLDMPASGVRLPAGAHSMLISGRRRETGLLEEY